MNRDQEAEATKNQPEKSKLYLDNSGEKQNQPSSILKVKWAYRWEVFRRLQVLGINCQCSTNEPLLVCLDSPVTVMQIWSVVRQSSASRQELISWLDKCWQVKYRYQDQ